MNPHTAHRTPHTARRARLAASALCAVSAVHAAVTAAATALEPRRVWGVYAALAYTALALVLALWAHWRKPDAPPHAATLTATVTVIHGFSPSAGGGEWAHPGGDQRLPAPPGRDREVRARDRAPLPAR
ncbi:hypothetical protein MMF93_26550 [Streptomyces tubbatahanensis]|uniref:Integral membrane protein n=1 Tax=Streptomyces tubbatahanensis TaxID=2923272 RepID=A0ABY3XYN1_9ACTN|nr:hypothetical protein [Streptomyces tubbatahanensis]UNS99611.1 hypothetical protein MMF93_26550 [Streptomyces tubbatahanensis]